MCIRDRDCTEECYAEILDYLCAVLEQEEFPNSYSVEFRGKEKLYLPIPGQMCIRDRNITGRILWNFKAGIL